MYTDDNGIVRFESLDNIAPLQVGLNAALESVSNQFDAQPLDQRLADILETVDSQTRLSILSLIGDVSQTQFPFRIAAGNYTLTPSAANTPTSVKITLPSGRFTKAPWVVTGMGTSVPGTLALGTGVTAASTTDFTLWFTRANTTQTSLIWIAVQV